MSKCAKECYTDAGDIYLFWLFKRIFTNMSNIHKSIVLQGELNISETFERIFEQIQDKLHLAIVMNEFELRHIENGVDCANKY